VDRALQGSGVGVGAMKLGAEREGKARRGRWGVVVWETGKLPKLFCPW